MPSAMKHSAAEILANVLIALGLGARPPAAANSWPIFFSVEPDLPDNLITVYNTTGRKHGRIQYSGETVTHKGVQLRIRATTPRIGQEKARNLFNVLDSTIYQDVVTIEDTRYLLHSSTQVGDVVDAGMEMGVSKRHVFTINSLLCLRQLATV